MSHKAKPSGINKSESTGVPSDFSPEKYNQDAKITNEFLEEDKNNEEQVKTTHPNRNVDKVRPTNIHGYRS